MRTGYIVPFLLFSNSACLAEFHGSLTFTNDYVWRGYSKSSGDFAAQINLDYEHDSGFYAGASASTINFGNASSSNRANFEIAPYLGWTFALDDDWRLDMQWNRYFYDGQISGQFSDYNEFYWLLHYSDLITVKTSFSDDFYHRGHVAGDMEFSGRYPLTDWLEFSSGVGYTFSSDALEYDFLYWNSGVSVYFKHVVLDFRYMDAKLTNESVDGNTGDSHEDFAEALDPSFVFTITVGF